MKVFLSVLKYIVIAAVIGAVAGVVSFRYVSKRLTMDIPVLEGRKLSEARAIARDMGITLNVTGEAYDRSVPSGHVVSQSIAPGEKVSGPVVQIGIVISKGTEVRQIVSVTGMPLTKAVTTLEKKSLAMGGVIRVHSDTIAQDTVLAQRPHPDEWAGEDITLVASAGPHEVVYSVPRFVDMDEASARRLASDLGLALNVRNFGESDVVTRQSLNAGDEVARGGSITLEVGGRRK